MSITTITPLPPQSDTTNLRLWAAGLHNALIAAGWVNTSDTGQTAPAALTGGIGLGGFEIFHPTDTLQGTAPFFVKLGYGSITGSDNRPAVYVSIGQGTDGAGNLTGNFTNVFKLGTQFGPSTTPYNCYFCGSTNRFNVSLWSDPGFNAYDNITFSIERTKDATGADTADGIIIHGQGTGSGTSFNSGFSAQSVNSITEGVSTVLPLGAFGVPAAVSPWIAPLNPLGSLQNGSNVGIVLPVPMGYQPYNPGLGVAIYQGTDFSPFTSQVIPGVYGASHTYMPLGQTTDIGGSSSVSGLVAMHAHIMLRWE
jgi:hypothetical protein